MNTIFTKRTRFLFVALFFISSGLFSQVKDVDFLKSAPVDGEKFLQAYITPWANAFGAGLNGGWYNTAKPHKLGGFDITACFNIGIVPSSVDKFDISSIGLSPSLSGSGLTPTISGPKTDGPAMAYQINGFKLASFNAPAGTEWKYIPVPSAQVGIGLPFGTELKVRFLPKITIQDGNVSLWGVGLLHSIMQYVPGNKMLPFDISLFGGYTKIVSNIPLGLKPDPAVNQNYTSPYNSSTSFDNQNLKVGISALNFSAIASLNLPVITFYGGIGYCKTKTAIEISGDFPLPVLVTPALPALPYPEDNNTGVKTGKDFPKINIENFSGIRANIGFRIKLAAVTIHADYTKAQYNVLSTGLGISFR